MQQEKAAGPSRFSATVLVAQALCIVGILLGLGVGLGLSVAMQPHVDNNGSLELSAGRGSQISISINAGQSIHGLWAAPGGIQVRLRNEEINYFQELKALKPTASGWYDDLTAVNDQRLAPTTIDLSFTLPDDIPGPGMQTLQGEITNFIVVPALVSPSHLDVVDREVAISLTIHLTQTASTLNHIWNNATTFGFTLAALSFIALTWASTIGREWVSRMGGLGAGAPEGASNEKSLMRALRHKDASVRRAAALALGEMYSYSAFRPLVDTLRDPDSQVRIAAVRALAKIGYGREAEALSIVAVIDNDAAVREAVTAALAHMPKPFRDGDAPQASPSAKPVE